MSLAQETEILDSSPRSLDRASDLLYQSKVVALPTETVYGLAGNAFDPEAVRKIFKAKDRPSFDPLIVHLATRYLTDPEGIIPALIRDGIMSESVANSMDRPVIETLMRRFWPGPLTLIVPRGPKIPNELTSHLDSVGIRMPTHPVFQAILDRLEFPLAAPSANRFGRISPTTAKHVHDELNGRIPAIVDGGSCQIGVESTILKIEDGHLTLLRPGGISASDLQKAGASKVSIARAAGQTAQAIQAPGMLDEHYAPTKPLFLIPEPFDECADPGSFLPDSDFPSQIALLSFAPIRGGSSHPLLRSLQIRKHRILSGSGDPSEAARTLYSTLRELDQDPYVDLILADLPSDHQSGLFAAIADRLNRASRNKPLLLRSPIP